MGILISACKQVESSSVVLSIPVTFKKIKIKNLYWIKFNLIKIKFKIMFIRLNLIYLL